MVLWLAVSLLILLLLVAAEPKIESEIRLLNRARLDFNNSRGTTHKNFIKLGLRNLRKTMKTSNARLKNLNSQKSSLKSEESRELENRMSTILVNAIDMSIPGIGPVLRDRIIRNCFDGTIESLRRANHVRGIGYEKYNAILRWINAKRSMMPQLLAQDFPGKNEIIRRYSQREKALTRELAEVDEELRDMKTLLERSNAALNSLNSVSMATFLKAYKGNIEASAKATQHMLGAYPEWSRTPTWFETLATKYGAA